MLYRVPSLADAPPAAADPPRPDLATLLADAERWAHLYPPRVQRLQRELLRELTPDQQARLLVLIGEVDDWAVDRTVAEEERLWRQVLAYAPGLEPALDLVRAHVRGSAPRCGVAGCPSAGA